MLKAFGVHQQIEPFLAQVLEPLGERGHEVTIRIIGFVNNLKVGVLGTVGVVTLFWTTFSTIDQIETPSTRSGACAGLVPLAANSQTIPASYWWDQCLSLARSR